MVCSYPRSRNNWKAAATKASRMGGFPVPAPAFSELMAWNVAPAESRMALSALFGRN
ncbi:hypothetical protein GCM10010383_57330 [Streptomyces lomondensis]|uniref:Uncharacterized protein n=1 Tax=Streptomyces lomondensis TaxID=68229 RepID=A0ABQ2XIU7_9ACTN|nr:hypothetical protein GCM10010383_57330 [Streptomyces lomondensis]